jgi:hypothetical protein
MESRHPRDRDHPEATHHLRVNSSAAPEGPGAMPCRSLARSPGRRGRERGRRVGSSLGIFVVIAVTDRVLGDPEEGIGKARLARWSCDAP